MLADNMAQTGTASPFPLVLVLSRDSHKPKAEWATPFLTILPWLKYETGYEEKRGGYCDLQVATLDPGIPSASKLVAAKKLLLGTRSNEPKRLAFRLARELKVWAGLRHPHVLPLLGFYLGHNYKTAVLISEYMVHGDLKDYITKMVPSYEQRLHLGNVLVNLQRRALLADFGLSKALDSGPTGFTTGNDARATVRFSGPEILLQGVAAQSLANDIWSWGCLVLEAMTDRIPFGNIQAETQLILALVQGRTPCDVESLALHLPQFHDLLAKCWRSEPNERPTAVDCLAAIQSALFSFIPTLQPPDKNAPKRTYDQILQSISQISHTGAAAQQETIIGKQPSLAFPDQPTPSDQEKPVNMGLTNSPKSQSPLCGEPKTPNRSPKNQKLSKEPMDHIVLPFANFQQLMLYGDYKFVKRHQAKQMHGQQAAGSHILSQNVTSLISAKNRSAFGLELAPMFKLKTEHSLSCAPRPTRTAMNISPAGVSSNVRPEPERFPTKRDREADVTGYDGSAGPSSPVKRARIDPQADLGSQSATYPTPAKKLSINTTLDTPKKIFDNHQRVVTAAAVAMASANGVTEQRVAVRTFEDPAFGETPDLVQSSSEDPTPLSEVTESGASIRISDGWYDWETIKPELDPESIGRSLIGDPAV
ncbi:hypothetical protein FRC00_009886 [Tulasnella sp. 408]|nr:hypothetical protein FRC00_009886 [Tulasnella sp. 408]